MNRNNINNRNNDPSAKKGSTARLAASVATAGAFAGLIALNAGEKGHDRDSGQPEQRDPKAPAARVSQAHEAEAQKHKIEGYHPAPFYDSDIGPDGKMDFYAHKITAEGRDVARDNNRIDGGTPAPAPEQPQK